MYIARFFAHIGMDAVPLKCAFKLHACFSLYQGSVAREGNRGLKTYEKLKDTTSVKD